MYMLDLKDLLVTKLASTPEYEVDPEFSADGKSVVYAAGKLGDRADHIFLRSLDGKTVKQLTADDANDSSPAFSPDGSAIVFTRDKTYEWGGLAANWSAGGVLCVMKSEGTDLRQLTTDGPMAFGPHFHPDGRTILFANENGPSTMIADGSGSPTSLGFPDRREARLSADGHSIVFSRGQYAPDSRIFIAQADGTGMRMVPKPGKEGQEFPSGGCFHPVFSPDGKRVIFFSESWPDGPTGHPKESLWEVDIEKGQSHEIADYTLFDDPLGWRPKSLRPAKAP
ncbi:hypothetical protein ACYOEI_06735 [Singulisphaera rosea]